MLNNFCVLSLLKVTIRNSRRTSIDVFIIIFEAVFKKRPPTAAIFPEILILYSYDNFVVFVFRDFSFTIPSPLAIPNGPLALPIILKLSGFDKSVN